MPSSEQVKNCAGSACHSPGTSYKQFIDSMSTFVDDSVNIQDRIQRPASDPSSMPRPGSGFTLTSAEIQTIISYLNQKTHT